MQLINVYDNQGNVIAKVEYNYNLNFGDGFNWPSGNIYLLDGKKFYELKKLKEKKFISEVI